MKYAATNIRSAKITTNDNFCMIKEEVATLPKQLSSEGLILMSRTEGTTEYFVSDSAILFADVIR